MKARRVSKKSLHGFLITTLAFAWSTVSADCPELLDHEFRKLHSSEILDVCQSVENAKAVLVVNTASHCGFTGQFAGLESLNQEYDDQGLIILGFPSDDFRQAANDESSAAKVCFVNYGVTFPMTAQIRVKGESAHPLFRYLAAKSSEPSWNFNKYLINPANQKVRHYDSHVTPESSELRSAIEKLL